MGLNEYEVDSERLYKHYTPYIAQIQSSSGAPVGGGFLLCKNFVISCAHVVNLALGRKPTHKDEPTTPVNVCFPCSPVSDNEAEVYCWYPPKRKSGKGEVDDIAILSLDQPVENKRGLTRFRYADTYKHDFVVLGFPKGSEKAAAWARGKTFELLPSKRLQVEQGSSGTPIQEGFSGAAVWDTLLNAVIGIAVLTRTKDRVAYLMPNRTLHKALMNIPELLECFKDRDAPKKCDARVTNIHDGDTVKHEQLVEGLAREIPKKHKLWPVLYTQRVNRHYPQNGPIIVDEAGRWDSRFFIGQPIEIGRSFVIELVQASPQAHSQLIDYQIEAGKSEHWPGLPELPEGSTVCDRVTVIRGRQF